MRKRRGHWAILKDAGQMTLNNGPDFQLQSVSLSHEEGTRQADRHCKPTYASDHTHFSLL